MYCLIEQKQVKPQLPKQWFRWRSCRDTLLTEIWQLCLVESIAYEVVHAKKLTNRSKTKLSNQINSTPVWYSKTVVKYAFILIFLRWRHLFRVYDQKCLLWVHAFISSKAVSMAWKQSVLAILKWSLGFLKLKGAMRNRKEGVQWPGWWYLLRL